MSPQENAVRIGEELGLCPERAAPLECMTRGDAAMLLFPLLTQSIEIAAPPILDVVPIHADASTDLNRYLVGRGGGSPGCSAGVCRHQQS